MLIKRVSLFLLFILFSFAFGSDIPQCPVNLDKGICTPEFSVSGSEASPAIAAISENTLPDETLVMSGYNLKGAKLKLWVESEAFDVVPLVAEHNRMTAIVPSDVPAATMLVYPYKHDVYGSPIRVNAPEAWWCFPEKVKVGNDTCTLKIMGKNFVIGDFKPKAFIKGSNFSGFVNIKNANPYQIEIDVAKLSAGNYQVWLHNGSGGDYGWSEPATFTIEKRDDYTDKEFSVADFGAEANDDKDDGSAVQAAVNAAVKVDGGVVVFSCGRYIISKPIVVSSKNIHFRGKGMGSYVNGEENISGNGTIISYPGASNIPDMLMKFVAGNCSVEDMTLVNASDGSDQNVLVFNGSDVTVKNCRIVMFDKRAWGYKKPGPWQTAGAKRDIKRITKKIIDKGAVLIDTEGFANVKICDSEIHAVGPGIQIGRFTGWESSKSKPLSESVLIDNVKFRGYYSGEPDGKPNSGASGRATGIVMYSGRKVAVENCSFEGVDRFNAKTMCRTILTFNSYGRYYYFANNESKNVGPHPSAIGMNENQGEQYLIHYRNLHGGLFDVVEAHGHYLTITTENIGTFAEKEMVRKTSDSEKKSGQNWNTKNPHFYYDNRGSQVLDEVKDDKNWILYVSKGRGVGQYREITGCIKKGQCYVFKLAQQWRVEPDSTSRVHLMAAYRNIVIYNNYVDTGKLVEETKTHGVCLWFYNFDNIIADNTFKNLTSGIIINSRFSGPTGWNTTRGNLIENVRGYAGDTSEIAAGYVDHFRLTLQWPAPEDRLWYQVGNVCRDNTIKNAEVGIYLHTRYTGYVRTKKPQIVPHPDSGIMMSVIENNTVINAGQGIVLSSPVNTSVVRGNQVEVNDNSHPAIYSQDGAGGLVDVVIMDNKESK